MSIIRAILDTNVWISALIFGGKPLDVVALARKRRFSVFTSPALMAEFDRVLAEKFHHAYVKRVKLQSLLAKITDLVEPDEVVTESRHDPDNRVLECAVAANADVIVSGDKKHLLLLGSFRTIPIVSPTEFLDRYAKKWQ